MSHSERLRQKIALVSSSLDRVGDALVTHPQLREMFPEFLYLTHCIIRASVPLMEAALASVHARRRSEQIDARLAEYLSKHIQEERHHDDWLLEDIEVLGCKRQQVLCRVPPWQVAALVGSQYYWIRHVNPVALLGYIAVMEADPPSTQLLEKLVRTTGLPADAFRTFFKHADVDAHHRTELNEVLDQMPLNAQHTTILGVSAFQTVHFLTLALEEFVASYPLVAPFAGLRRVGRTQA